MNWKISDNDRAAQSLAAQTVVSKAAKKESVFAIVANHVTTSLPDDLAAKVCNTILSNAYATDKQKAVISGALSHPANAYLLHQILEEVRELENRSEAQKVIAFYGNDPLLMADEILELRAQVAKLEHMLTPPEPTFKRPKNDFFN